MLIIDVDRHLSYNCKAYAGRILAFPIAEIPAQESTTGPLGCIVCDVCGLRNLITLVAGTAITPFNESDWI